MQDNIAELSKYLSASNAQLVKSLGVSTKLLNTMSTTFSNAMSKVTISAQDASDALRYLGESIRPKPIAYIREYNIKYPVFIVRGIPGTRCKMCKKSYDKYVRYTKDKDFLFKKKDHYMCLSCASKYAADNKSKLKLLYKKESKV